MQIIIKSIVIMFFLAGSIAQADALLIDKVRQDNQQQVERPTRGMSKAAVASQFGEPKDKVAAVGKPPISRWVYDNYIVFFEKDRVLHSVVRR